MGMDGKRAPPPFRLSETAALSSGLIWEVDNVDRMYQPQNSPPKLGC